MKRNGQKEAESLFQKRMKSVEQAEAGLEIKEVAKQAGWKPWTIHKLIRDYKEKGVDGLKPTKSTGRDRKISKKDLDSAIRRVRSRHPTEQDLDVLHKWSNEKWAREIYKETKIKPTDTETFRERMRELKRALHEEILQRDARRFHQ